MLTTNKKRVQIQVDQELANETEQILQELGLTPTTVVTMLYKRIAANGSLPFDVVLTESEKANIHFLKSTENTPIKEFKNAEEVQSWLEDDDED